MFAHAISSTEPDRKLQQHEHARVIAREQRAQRAHVDREARRFHEGCEARAIAADRAEAIEVAMDDQIGFVLRVGDRPAGREARDARRKFEASLRIGFLRGLECERHVERGLAVGEHEAARHHADDVVALAVEPDIASDDGGIGVEPGCATSDRRARRRDRRPFALHRR